MPLDDEEKQILKEKYKKHRQSIWFGKSDKKRKKKKDSIENSVSGDDEVGGEHSVARKTTPEPDAKTFTSQSRTDRRYQSHYEQSGDEARTDVILPTMKSRSTRDNATFEPKRASSHSHDDTEITPKQKSPTAESVASEPDIVQLSVRPRTQRGGIITENPSVRTPKQRESGVQANAEFTREKKFNTDEVRELKDKVKDQRWSIWTGTSSRKQRKPKARRRKSKKGEREFWQSTQENESSDDKKGLTWGIVFMVIFGIVGAIVLGIFLGYYYVRMAG